MPGTREELIERIHRLRRLADDVAGTPEGTAATRKVRELMKRYGISAADLRPTSAPHVHHEVPKPARRPKTPAPASTPVTFTLKIGNVRIRWKP